MKIDAVQKKLNQWAEGFLRPEGFTYVRGADEYRRKIEGGTQSFAVIIKQGYPNRIVSFLVGVRIDAIQHIFNMFAGVSPTVHDTNESLAVRVQGLVEDIDELLESFNPDESLPPQSVEERIRKVVIPFLNETVTLNSVDRVLNETDLCHTMHPYRAMAAVIAAKLSGNPRFDEIVQSYQQDMEDLIPDERIKYDHLLTYLHSL